MKRAWLWIGGTLLYGVFFGWYTNLAGPLTDNEIEIILERASRAGQTQVQLDTLEHFMRTDTGDDFVMINLLDLNESPPTLPETGPNATAFELINHYMAHMYPEQFARASHPIFFGPAVADAMDISGIEGASHWDLGALFRYRSRRDVMEIAGHPAFSERHDYKMAALIKTIAYPVEPSLNPADFRVLFALVLFSILSVADMLLFRRQAVSQP